MKKYFIDQLSEPFWKRWNLQCAQLTEKEQKKIFIGEENQAAELLQGQGHVVSESEQEKV